MKTEFTSNNKDNIGISTIIAASLLVIASGLFNSNAAVSKQAVNVQKYQTIVVTASRTPEATLETMVVTASRKNTRA